MGSASGNGQQDLGNLSTAGLLALGAGGGGGVETFSVNKIPAPTGAFPLHTSLTQAPKSLQDEMNTATVQGQLLPFG